MGLRLCGFGLGMELTTPMGKADNCGKREEAGLGFGVRLGFGPDYNNSLILAVPRRPLDLRHIFNQTHIQPRWGRQLAQILEATFNQGARQV